MFVCLFVSLFVYLFTYLFVCLHSKYFVKGYIGYMITTMYFSGLLTKIDLSSNNNNNNNNNNNKIIILIIIIIIIIIISVLFFVFVLFDFCEWLSFVCLCIVCLFYFPGGF